MASELDNASRLSDLEVRLTALEKSSPAPTVFQKNGELLLATLGQGVALYALTRGVGAPNHPYQWALGILVTLMAYHSRKLQLPRRHYEFLLVFLNFAVAILLSKLLIGGGIRHPFDWMQYPSLSFSETKEKWYSLLPSTQFQWQPSALAAWTVDLTVVQSFCAVLCAFTTAVRFQPFASFCGLLLVLFSIPALVEFDWGWVFPGLVAAATGFYLQLTKLRT